jgi:signal transduction histidine kinase
VDRSNPTVDPAQLERQYAELARLAGGLAHEIKNPLSTLNLNLQLLAEDFQHAEGQRERRALQKIDRLREVVGRLEGLLDDFLRFARVDRLRLEPTDLAALVEEMIDFYAPQAEAHGIVTRADAPAGTPAANVDREMMKQAIFNLMLNAQHAMPNGGELMLRLRSESDRVLLDVIDTGVGMTPEVQAKIFEPFFSTRSKGSGLGLPTARRIVEAHGGELTVVSAPGKGTAFTVALPRAS